MRLGTLLLLAAASMAQTRGDELARELDEVARVATAMVDGDLCRRIQTPRSAGWMTRDHPRDKWFAADNFDVNHEAYTRTKKTLIRLSRLAKNPCDVNLWMPVETTPRRIQILIRNVNEMSQFWTWGALHQEMFPEMEKVLRTGERVAVRKRAGMASVVAPVYDSLGDIVGLVEVVGRLASDSHENVK
jgi:hypothetical protein